MISSPRCAPSESLCSADKANTKCDNFLFFFNGEGYTNSTIGGEDTEDTAERTGLIALSVAAEHAAGSLLQHTQDILHRSAG